jgi:hypothetical protein
VPNLLNELTHHVRPRVATRAVPTATGAFYHTALYSVLRRINYYLMRWVRKKYRKVRTFKKFHKRWKQVIAAWPNLFAHWKWVHPTPSDDLWA